MLKFSLFIEFNCLVRHTLKIFNGYIINKEKSFYTTSIWQLAIIKGNIACIEMIEEGDLANLQERCTR